MDSFLLRAKFGASFTKLLERGPCVCVCVCAIITTFSKHLRPPGPVFIAGNRDGPTLVRKTISEDGREKNGGLEGRRMTRKGCAEGQRARRGLQTGPSNCDVLNER